jgi:hypothetical protein
MLKQLIVSVLRLFREEHFQYFTRGAAPRDREKLGDGGHILN